MTAAPAQATIESRRAPQVPARLLAGDPLTFVSERTQIIRLVILGLATLAILYVLDLELTQAAQLVLPDDRTVILATVVLMFQMALAFWREHPLPDWIFTARGRRVRVSWPVRWHVLWLTWGAIEGFCIAKQIELSASNRLAPSLPPLARVNRGTIAAVGGLIVGFGSVAMLLICAPIFATYAQKYRHSLGYDRGQQVVTDAFHQAMNWLATVRSQYGISRGGERVIAPKLEEVPLLSEDEPENSDSSPTIVRAPGGMP